MRRRSAYVLCAVSSAKVLAALTATFVAVLGMAVPARAAAPAPGVRVVAISYRAHDGRMRHAYLILPTWYGPAFHPAIPLVISPHGRRIRATRLERHAARSAVGRRSIVLPSRARRYARCRFEPCPTRSMGNSGLRREAFFVASARWCPKTCGYGLESRAGATTTSTRRAPRRAMIFRCVTPGADTTRPPLTSTR